MGLRVTYHYPVNLTQCIIPFLLPLMELNICLDLKFSSPWGITTVISRHESPDIFSGARTTQVMEFPGFVISQSDR